MFTCPKCQKILSKAKNEFGIFWVCPSCKGRTITIEVMRKAISQEVVSKLWHTAKFGDCLQKRNCPICRGLMSEVALSKGNESSYIDVCPACHIVWFDTNEYDQLPKAAIAEKPEDEMSLESKQAIAIAQVKMMSENQRDEGPSLDSLEDLPRAIPALFGLPIEEDDERPENRPVITWVLAFIIAAVGIIELLSYLKLINFADYKILINNWGLIPSELGRYHGLTFISSVFLHKNVFYFLLNFYLLMVFGEHVEDVLGKWCYALLLVCSAAAGAGLHIAIYPTSQNPLVGAGAAVAGAITYYALRFPNAEIGFFTRFGRAGFWTRQPAIVFFLGWLVIMFFFTYRQIYEGWGDKFGFSALDVLGGAAVGFIFWLVFLRKSLLSDLQK